MKRNNAWIKGLAFAGTFLVFVPVVAPLAMMRWGALGSGHFNFDWLIPAELFPVVAVGAALLLTASLLSHARRAWVVTGIGVMIGMIGLGMAMTALSGLASGAVEPSQTGWWPVAVALIAGYIVGIVLEGVAGILLIRDLLSHHVEKQAPEAPATPSPAV